LMFHLDGSQAMMNIWRMKREWALSFTQNDLPVVVFIDFGHQGNMFSHLGGYAGYGYPADTRAEYLRIYPYEIYASGSAFCYPVIESQFDAWIDTLSNGTRLIDVIKQQTGFLNTNKEIYHNVVKNEMEYYVTVNGVIPFNGEWNVVNGQLDSPVNESKVTISYMDAIDGSRSFLHIINHNWDDTNQVIITQTNIPVNIPVRDGFQNVFVVSPDFPDTLYPDFTIQDSILNLTLPSFEYYDVLILEFSPTSVSGNNLLNKPNKILLYQNYPNPFNLSTVIHYSISVNNIHSSDDLKAQTYVTLKIYNLLGEEIRTLVNKNQQAGNYSVVWDGRDDFGRQVGSGIYFYRLKLNSGFSQTKKLILLK